MVETDISGRTMYAALTVEGILLKSDKSLEWPEYLAMMPSISIAIFSQEEYDATCKPGVSEGT